MTENIRSRILAESLIVRCIEWHDAEKKQLWYVEAAILKYCHRNLLEGRRQMPMPDFDYIAHFEQVIGGTSEAQRSRDTTAPPLSTLNVATRHNRLREQQCRWF